jgi:hypothetical protein
VPISRASFSGVMEVVADMGRPFHRQDAILQHVASWGDRIPHALIKNVAWRRVNGARRPLSNRRQTAYATLTSNR